MPAAGYAYAKNFAQIADNILSPKYPLRQIGFFVVVLVDNWWESAFNKSLIRIVE